MRISLNFIKSITAICACMFSSVAFAEWAIDFQTPVSPTAKDLLSLHHLIFYICLVIGIAVFAVMFYSIFAHRKSKGAEAASFSHSTKLEVIWTIIPVIILVIMAIPSTKSLIKMEDTTDADITIKVTGYQWFWQYEYREDNVSFFSKLSTPYAQIHNQEEKGENYLLEVDNQVVLPVGKKVRFLFTAADVIHAWWVPALGVKKDAIPGYINESWTIIDEPGVYRGVCAELCGKDHGYMPIVVKAVEQNEYDQWVKDNSVVEENSLAQN